MILNILVFLIVLGVIVLVHELGHFLMAKKADMIVDEFGIGFPPTLFSWTRRGTKYSLNIIPLGGFVKIRGESYNEEEEKEKDPRLFYNRPLLARLKVILAGIFMNFLLGWLILFLGFSVGFPSLTRDLSKVSSAKVIKQEVVIAQVNKNSPASQAKIEPGTVIKSAENSQFKTIEDLQKFTKSHQGQTIDFQVITPDDQVKQVSVKLANSSSPLGVVIIPDNIVRFPLPMAFVQSGIETYQIGKLTATAIVQLVQDLLFHAKINEQISGPIGIYQATAQATQIGFLAVVLLIAIITINLALLNIVPFPGLDGGKLIFLLIESIFRKRVIAVRLEQAIETIGFFLLILFVLAVTYKDIIRIG